MKETNASASSLIDYAQLCSMPGVTLCQRDVSEDYCSEDTSRALHVIGPAWKALDLKAAITIHNQPTVYFTEVGKKDLEYETRLHRQFWNQGTATILVVADPSEVRFYSSFVSPKSEVIKDNDSGELRLIEALDLSSFAIQEFAMEVVNGKYYQRNQEHFDSSQCVDQLLLGNLRTTLEQLKREKLPDNFAHSLIGRVLFLFYLQDRGIIPALTNAHYLNVEKSDLRDSFAKFDAEEAKEKLFTLFESLHPIFNGSLFGGDLEESKRHITVEHIQIIQKLITGKQDVKSGQNYLWEMYDFEMIPIELISTIYESFLQANPKKKKNFGAFYTPRFLAESTVDVAVENWNTLLDKKVLDPACGSGIFLVILFKRMSSEWINRNPKASIIARWNAMKSILTELYGIDVNETAVHITCFSLYLAFLDQMKSGEISELQTELIQMNPREKILPILFGKTILCRNFFELPLNFDITFDLVIGNPPWTGRNHKQDPKILSWIDKRCESSEQKCQKNDLNAIFFPQRQSAVPFLWKSLDHVSGKSLVCFLIPTRVLLGTGMLNFQKKWLSETSIERIVQMADFRHILFENAKCPGTIVRFNCNKPDFDNAIIIHDTPKVSRNDPRSSFVTIYQEDRHLVYQYDILEARYLGGVTSAWKQLFRGTERDFRLIRRLENIVNPQKTIGNLCEKEGWASGQGFKVFHQEKADKKTEYPTPKRRKHPDSWIYVDANAKDVLNLALVKSEHSPIGDRFQTLYSLPKDEIFKPPLVLINQGFTHFAYVDFPVLFQDSLQSIACQDAGENKTLLLFLCGVLNTKMAMYYYFHTSANLGVERSKVHLDELKRFPFPLPDDFDNPQDKWKIVERVAKYVLDAKAELERENTLPIQREEIVSQAKKGIQKLVYEYYEIAPWEEILIDDTVDILMPSVTPKRTNVKKLVTLQPSDQSHRKQYADLLCKAINTWCHHPKMGISAHAELAEEFGLGVLILEKQPISESESAKYREEKIDSSKAVEMILSIQRSLREQNPSLVMQKRYVYFEPDRAYIIKPLQIQCWTRTAALNDADDIFAAMFNAKLGGE